jgi:alpha-L-fucosidase 2
VTRLRFAGPAAEWLEALPLGDGCLGAMCFGDPSRPVFQLNHGTGWSGGPVPPGGAAWAAGLDRPTLLGQLREALAAGDHAEAERLAKLFQDGDVATYLPLAELTLVGGAATSGLSERVLDLATAVHTAVGAGLTHETFVSGGVLAHRITGPAAARRAFRPELTTLLRELDRIETDDGTELTVRFPTAARDGVFEWADGRESVTAAIAVRLVHASDESLLALAAVTDYVDGVTPPHGRVGELARQASDRIDAALGRGWSALLADHLRTHGELWNRTRLELAVAEPSATVTEAIARGDAAELTQLQFDLGRYLLISSSRPGGLPPTLQGLWNAQPAPPWRSNFTININTEMNHWAAAVTRLPECVAPLLDHLESLAVTGAEMARRVYGARGWAAHHNTDAWAYAGQSGEGADNPSWAFWPFGGVWLTLTACELLDFGLLSSADRSRLAVLVRGCAEFLLDWLVPGPDGLLTTSPSTSPENEFALPGGRVGSLSTGSTMDLTLARALFERCLAFAEPSPRPPETPAGVVTSAQSGPGELCAGDDSALTVRVTAALERLPHALPLTDEPEPEVREWGGGERAVDPHHRHVSHLVGVYPGTAPLGDPERAAVTRTLERRGDDSTGWSLAWKTCLWARLGRGDKVDALLALSRRPSTETTGYAHRGGLYPNLFAAHPPFQIDANLGFPAGVAEALLQSHRGVIELLPALPPSLPDGRVTGLLARPGVVVDLEWADGRLVEAVLRRPDTAASGAADAAPAPAPAPGPCGRDSALTLGVSYSGHGVSVEIPSAGEFRLSANEFAAGR